MIDETIKKLERQLREVDAMDQGKRAEILGLLNDLKQEVNEVAVTNREHAESISAFATASAHEATRKEHNPELLELSLKGLQSSVHGFEQTHPKLVGVVDRVCRMLSNLGI